MSTPMVRHLGLMKVMAAQLCSVRVIPAATVRGTMPTVFVVVLLVRTRDAKREKGGAPERTQHSKRKLIMTNCLFNRETASLSFCTVCGILDIPINLAVKAESHSGIGAQHVDHVKRVEGVEDSDELGVSCTDANVISGSKRPKSGQLGSHERPRHRTR
jgi:hypothetical protein